MRTTRKPRPKARSRPCSTSRSPYPTGSSLPPPSSGALFGALSAVRARYDIFGVSCIAIVTGLAGGIMRDILNAGLRHLRVPKAHPHRVVRGCGHHRVLPGQAGDLPGSGHGPSGQPVGGAVVHHRHGQGAVGRARSGAGRHPGHHHGQRRRHRARHLHEPRTRGVPGGLAVRERGASGLHRLRRHAHEPHPGPVRGPHLRRVGAGSPLRLAVLRLAHQRAQGLLRRGGKRGVTPGEVGGAPRPPTEGEGRA